MQPEKEFDSKVKDFKRDLVRGLLDQCTEAQQIFFDRLYKGIEQLEEKNMKIAYGQCARTLEKAKGEQHEHPNT